MAQRNTLASLGILAVVGFGGGLALAQDRGTEPSGNQDPYTMTTRLLVADTCPGVCPGLFPKGGAADAGMGSQPGSKMIQKTPGAMPNGGAAASPMAHEDLVIGIIEDGKVGDISLKDAKWAMVAEVDPSGKLVQKAVYIDANAKADQKKGLRKIFGSRMFKKDFGSEVAISEIPIDVSGGKEALEAWTVKLGDKGTVVITPLAGGNGHGPTVIENPVYPFPAYKVICAKADGEFRDQGTDLKLAGKSGQISHFVMKGDADTMPAGMKKEPANQNQKTQPVQPAQPVQPSTPKSK